MKLYGSFGSPFTRRVGVTLLLYKLKHEHVVLRGSIPEELEQLRKINPLARVPALETEDGMALVDSVTILDYLDQQVDSDILLTPREGEQRTKMLNLIGIAAGAVEKSVSCYYEEGVNAKRPADKVYRPWVDKMYEQTKDGLEAIETLIIGPWIMGDRLSQADVSLVCFWDFIKKHRPESAPRLNCPQLEKISDKANLKPVLGALVSQLAVTTCGVPQYTVDLDMPARQRWRHIARDYKDYLLTSVIEWEWKIPDRELNAWAEVAQVPSEYKEELQGFVDELNHPNITLNQFIVRNIAYEKGVSIGCSGGLAAMENGTMIHGRNMDLNVKAINVNGKSTSLEDVTIEVNFLRKNKPIFTGVFWPGGIGFHTAMRYGGWTIEQNTRFRHNNVSNNFEAMTKGMLPHTFVTRMIMEQTPDFDDAVHALSTARFAAPQYFIVAGSRPFQGAVVSVDRGGHLLPGTPPVQYVHQGKKDWFLIQTNDDLLAEPKDGRRETGELAMEVIGQKAISVNTVMRVMQTEPVWNGATLFTWVASPGLGTHIVKVHRESKMELRERKKAFLRRILT